MEEPKSNKGGAYNFSGSRPQYKDEGRMVGYTIMLTEAQRGYLTDLGGAKWLRKTLDDLRGVSTPVPVREQRKLKK